MKVLLVGGGAREHALAWKLAQDDPHLELLAAPGNPGIAEIARCVPVRAEDVVALTALAESERVELTVVGPEAPLAAGLVDRFRDRGLPVFGPTQRAAAIETSKSYAKQLMLDAGIPTAAAIRHTDPRPAKQSVRAFGVPVVVKAAGLAAGKGVVVCQSLEEADDAIDAMLTRGAFGAAGAEILVEEFMHGEELSLFAITDGDAFISMMPVQDHKRLGEADTGPNTGGMGAYAPVSLGTPALVDEANRRVFAPTLAALRERGRKFTGLLYAGLMVSGEGLRVVEFNCRFGDPEAEAILPLLASPLLDILAAVGREESIGGVPPLAWRPLAAVATVVAAGGYPEAPRTGAAITLPAPPLGVHVFHAGTSRSPSGELLAAGGRVVTVTALGADVRVAGERSRHYAESVQFDGKQFRRDIGWREGARGARTP